MIITINDNIEIWKEVDPFEFNIGLKQTNSTDFVINTPRLLPEKERIAIRGRWFDVINPSELVRSRNDSDGYYRVIYIQINMESGEYYIGKANRPTWSQLKRYQGSGLKFSNKFKKHGSKFVRYYIATCDTQEETEALEASIVDSELLADEKCLNLVSGGGGITNRTSLAESSQKKREHMLKNPSQYKSMLEASKKAFQSGDTAQLRARNERIKKTMSAEKYREMSSDRMKNWKENNPKEYAEARRRNKKAIRNPEVQKKKKESFDKWVKENPEEYRAWQEKLIESRTSPEANEKRKDSLKAWREKNPEQASKNVKKRAQAAADKLRKEVCMIDLQSGEVLKTFPSQKEAARWLVEEGKAKNMNCASSISSVCLRSPCSTGYGYRKKAYGYDWRFSSDIEDKG